MTNQYQQLLEKCEEISLLGGISATLAWDQETYLPAKSVEFRAKQLSYLSGKIHELSTGDDFRKKLEAAEGAGTENVTEAANIREWRHSFDLSNKLPQALVERSSKAESLGQNAWAEARKKNEFSLFAPHMEQLVEIAKEKAELWGYEDEPYDALLGCYERGAKTSDVAKIFGEFEPKVTELARKAVEKSNANPGRKFEGDFPIEKQQILNREVAESIGFDFDGGRIDTTTHPFCTTLGPLDIRLTTRYYEHDFTASLFGVMHEAGHGLYEQGLPTDDFGMPSGTAISLGIHESQSLLWEAHVGRSRGFWNKWFSRAQELFPQMKDWSVDEFLQTINQAKYSQIRVDADEATYDLHIMLRFGIEREILNGNIAIADIPAAWNERFEQMFGMPPESDAQGCLQDVHWSMGGLGYFSTYSLGNLNASQLFHKACEDTSVKTAFDEANYAPLLGWMRQNIHAHGSTYLPQELMKKATGEGTNASYHLAHLERRFLG